MPVVNASTGSRVLSGAGNLVISSGEALCHFGRDDGRCNGFHIRRGCGAAFEGKTLQGKSHECIWYEIRP